MSVEETKGSGSVMTLKNRLNKNRTAGGDSLQSVGGGKKNKQTNPLLHTQYLIFHLRVVRPWAEGRGGQTQESSPHYCGTEAFSQPNPKPSVFSAWYI